MLKLKLKSDLLSILSSDRGEPVDVVDGTTLHGPLLHTTSHTVSVLLGEGLASGYKVKTISSSKSFNQTGDVLTNGVLELHEEILAQGGELCRIVEDIDSNALEHRRHRAGQVSHLVNGRKKNKKDSVVSLPTDHSQQKKVLYPCGHDTNGSSS